jgi:hypothetical protein
LSEATNTDARAQLLLGIEVPPSTTIDTSSLSRGIDNYHIDVRLSDAFTLHAREIIEKVVKRVAAGNRPTTGADEMDEFRTTYREMMTASLHRTKSDLTPEKLNVLHFGVIKFLLKEVRSALFKLHEDTESAVAQQQYAGSRSLLATQERLAWLRKHNDDFLFRANRAVLQQIQREENGLRELRKQVLPATASDHMNVLFNPMLCADSPVDVGMLTDCYSLWPNGGKGFAAINLRLEDTLQEFFPELKVVPLKAEAKIEATEVYDTLHGLFTSQDILGPSEDQSTTISESYGWLEQPGNVRQLFDPLIHERELRELKESLGMKGQWDLKGDLKKLLKVASDLRKKMYSELDFKEAVACYLLRGNWTAKDQLLLDIRYACAYIAGNDSKKAIARLDPSREGAASLLRKLDDLELQLAKSIKEEGDEYFLRMLSDLFRYRLHLKYFRFAHRALNRIKVITEAQEIQLAKAGGTLYELLDEAGLKDVKKTEKEIIHHVILKADVRGSTTVTRELLNKELNPASYFSLRFFGPINERLQVYGAAKVFIEGDAVILGFYEHNDAPEHWYAMSRACGMAKEILDIVTSKNAHAAKTGLPGLEVGIGICFSKEKPMFLFDEDKPIMISSAIGEADRLSSCSWRLREAYDGHFNVDVLEIAATDEQHGEKGQRHLQYNLNGIILSEAGFKKLMAEIPLKKLRLKISDQTESMFFGKFPDVHGKERELVIRAGRVGRWDDGKIETGGLDEVFYEVLPNSKLSRQVTELAKKTN